MPNYTLRVKKLYRPDYSSIIVWLDDDKQKDQEIDQINRDNLTLFWIGYHVVITQQIDLAKRDIEELVSNLLDDFHEEYSDVMFNLFQVTDMEEAKKITDYVSLFITECVAHQNRMIG